MVDFPWDKAWNHIIAVSWPHSSGDQERSQNSPVSVTHKGFDVQIHRDIFGWSKGNTNTAREILGTGVDHMALSFKYALSKDQHSTDDCVLATGRKCSSQIKSCPLATNHHCFQN